MLVHFFFSRITKKKRRKKRKIMIRINDNKIKESKNKCFFFKKSNCFTKSPPPIVLKGLSLQNRAEVLCL